MVLFLDDLQWVDDDGMQFLQSLLRPPEAPAALFLFTARAGEADHRIEAFRRLGTKLEMCALRGMAGHDLVQLAKELGLDADGERMQAAARATGGNPLFLATLLRSDGAFQSVDEAVVHRAEKLPGLARDALELLCVIGRPTRQVLLADTLGARFGDVVDAMRELEKAHFVRLRGVRRNDLSEPFHDRVRESIAARVEAERARDLHGRYAMALERKGSHEVETLFEHWRLAGSPERAIPYGLRAADKAREGLAFDNAARVYRELVALAPRGGLDKAHLLGCLAEVLALGGRTEQSARAFESASQAATGLYASHYRRACAEQWLASMRAEEGLAATAAMLAEWKLPRPAEGIGVILQLVFGRMLLVIERFLFIKRTRASRAATGADQVKLDALLTAVFGYANIRPIWAAFYQMLHHREALRLGDAENISLSVAFEMPLRAVMQGEKARATVADLARQAKRWATPNGRDRVGLQAGRCAMHLFLCDYDACMREEEALREVVLKSPPFVQRQWVVNNARGFALSAAFIHGDYDWVRRTRDETMADAERRGDSYLASLASMFGSTSRWLFEDDLERAEREIASVEEKFVGLPYSLFHFGMSVSRVQCAWYRGDARGAYAIVKSEWEPTKKNHLDASGFVLAQSWHMLAVSAMGVAMESEGGERVRLLQEAERAWRQLRRLSSRWSTAQAVLVEACLHHARGDSPGAAQALSAAALVLHDAALPTYAAAADMFRGAIDASPEGTSARLRGIAALRERGVRTPEVFARVLAMPWLNP